ncbi:hypothetical protein J6O48_07725 [bacterium]|nr:hypothetical protein [bacterium]
MKSFNTVYNRSKKEVLDSRQRLFESQKDKIISVLKETYMITGSLTDLNPT